MVARRLSKAEREVWQRVAASVSPMKRRSLAPRTIASSLVKSTDPPREQQSEPTAAASVFPKSSLGQAQAFSRAETVLDSPQQGLDKRTVQRLRRGKMPVEGRLDLHGMTQSQAYGALMRFIAASQVMNRRMVLVITGKGWDPMARRPEEAIGVLRRIVPRWLVSPPLNSHVVGVSDAHPKDGGTGALYVLLRRSRRLKPRTED
jgi:DNA-nicking Smr family endonuclease